VPATVSRDKGKSSGLVWGIAGIAAVIVIGVGIWRFTSSPEPAPADTPVAEVAPTPAAATPEPTPAAPTPPPAPAGPTVEEIGRRVADAVGRNDLEGALTAVASAGPSAQDDPALQRSLDQILAAARNNATQAFNRVRSNAGRADAEFNAGQAKRTEAAEFVKQGRKADAARSFIAAEQSYARVNIAKPGAPASTASAPPTAAPTQPSSAQTTPTLPAATPPPPPPVEVAAAPPVAPPVREPEPAPKPASPVRDPAQDVAAIRAVLNQFVAGYQGLNFDVIRRVWPGAPTVNFSGVKSYQMQLTDPQVTVQGDTATVVATRQVRVQNAAGRPQENTGRVVFTLRRTPSGWLIDGVK
jgi:ketosteroid isomerase-like protein